MIFDSLCKERKSQKDQSQRIKYNLIKLVVKKVICNETYVTFASKASQSCNLNLLPMLTLGSDLSLVAGLSSLILTSVPEPK